MESLNKIKHTTCIGLMLLFLMLSFWVKDVTTEQLFVSLSFVFLILAIRPFSIKKKQQTVK